ncbi:MAG: hypothetical protein JKY58_11275 [Pseudomonas sp.]|nr:hypothetical protein [Pseudomonas sp.]
MPSAELIGNLVPLVTKGAKEWPDLSDWNLPARFITSPRVVTGVNLFTKMTMIVRRSLACLAKSASSTANGKGLPSPWQELKNQIYMGSEQFVADMQQEIDLAQRLDEFPASQHRPPPLPLEHYASAAAHRDAAILQAYQSGGYTLQAIGNHFGLHYSRVSRIVSRAKSKTDPDRSLIK